MSSRLIHITLNPPYVLGADDARKTLLGWCEVDDEQAPGVSVRINGSPAPLVLSPRPQVRNHFPGMQVRGIRVDADFATLLRESDRMQDQGGFLLSVQVRSDDRERTFEYGVTREWLRAVFGEDLAPYPMPPAHLQIRVAGAAAGGFVAAGRRVACQIEDLLNAHASGFPTTGRVHDFGCGPGRVTQALAVRHPAATFSGSDIDAEAIDWCAAEMGRVGRFFLNAPRPPLALADAELDLAFSISIFTHLPEDMQNAWLAELRRVIRPGGHLVTTKLNPSAYDLPPGVAAAARETGFAYFGEARAVDGLPDFYRLAYHSEDYVRRVWGQHFEVLHVGAHDLNDTQDAVILRRPA